MVFLLLLLLCTQVPTFFRFTLLLLLLPGLFIVFGGVCEELYIKKKTTFPVYHTYLVWYLSYLRVHQVPEAGYVYFVSQIFQTCFVRNDIYYYNYIILKHISIGEENYYYYQDVFRLLKSRFFRISKMFTYLINGKKKTILIVLTMRGILIVFLFFSHTHVKIYLY